jgi:hypothetical protein
MKGPVHARDAMFVECKGRRTKSGYANKLFRSIYLFIHFRSFGVEPARCKDLCMHLRGAVVYIERGWTCLLGVPQRDAVIKQ